MTFDLAEAIWNQRETLAGAKERLFALRQIVNTPLELSLGQWGQWFSVTMDFKPDLIIEFGRASGNSTALFTEAANRLGTTKVISLCLSTDWQRSTSPGIKKIVENNWFDKLDDKVCNFISEDIGRYLDSEIAKSQRVLLLWDAHGFDVAEFILGRVMPQVSKKQNLILMHDICDIRYCPEVREYNGQGVWRGGYDADSEKAPRLVLGNSMSPMAQLLAASEFSGRNHLCLESADHSVATELTAEKRQEVENAWGDMWEFPAQYHFFNIENPENLTFPTWALPSERGLDGLDSDEKIKQLTQQLALIQNSRLWKLRTKLVAMLKRN